jgi:hypothetical protein
MSMNLVIFDVDGTLIQSTGVDDACFARAVEVAWGIPNISTQWDDYPSILGAVLIGIGAALSIEWRQMKLVGLGIGGAIAINPPNGGKRFLAPILTKAL